MFILQIKKNVSYIIWDIDLFLSLVSFDFPLRVYNLRSQPSLIGWKQESLQHSLVISKLFKIQLYTSERLHKIIVYPQHLVIAIYPKWLEIKYCEL